MKFCVNLELPMHGQAWVSMSDGIWPDGQLCIDYYAIQMPICTNV